MRVVFPTWDLLKEKCLLTDADVTCFLPDGVIQPTSLVWCSFICNMNHFWFLTTLNSIIDWVFKSNRLNLTGYQVILLIWLSAELSHRLCSFPVPSLLLSALILDFSKC